MEAKTMLKTGWAAAKRIVVTAILVAAIWYLVSIIIEGKYLPFLGNFGQYLLDKFLELVETVKSWLIK